MRVKAARNTAGRDAVSQPSVGAAQSFTGKGENEQRQQANDARGALGKIETRRQVRA